MITATLIRSHFFGWADQAAVAGNRSNTQILNPAGSGVTLYVWRIICQTDVEQRIVIARHDTALTNESTVKGNKVLGGGAPAAALYYNSDAAALGTILAAVRIAAAQPFPVYLSESVPIVVPAGAGLLVRTSAANVRLETTFEWWEGS